MPPTRRMFIQASGAALISLPPVRAVGATETIQTPVLTIAYEDSGPRQGFPIILSHGFPEDVRAFDEVAPPLVEAGWSPTCAATDLRASAIPPRGVQASKRRLVRIWSYVDPTCSGRVRLYKVNPHALSKEPFRQSPK